MDPTLKRFQVRTQKQPTIGMSFLVDGVIISGVIAHPSRLEEDLSEILETVAEKAGDETHAATLRGYAFNEELDAYDEESYLTLSDVSLTFAASQTSVNLRAARVRIDSIAAWWPGLIVRQDEARREGDVSG